MASLGNVETGGFSKESIAAMQDPDYFKPQKGFKGFDARDFLGKAINDALIDKESPYYFDQEKKSYREEEKESLEDRLADLLDKYERGGGGVFSKIGSDFYVSSPDNSARDAAILQQNQAELQKEPSVIRKAGSALVNAGIGALATKALSFLPFFCDIRLKEDIAPLCVSEVNDQLSECAFFVKGLNECS